MTIWKGGSSLTLTDIPSRPGTYLFVMKCERDINIRVGQLGNFAFQAGWYAYVGSALGPGGVAARLRHHLRVASKPHWHIDYLTEHARPVELWQLKSRQRFEHLWAEILRTGMHASIPLKGFGASDCACAAHLFYSAAGFCKDEFVDLLRKQTREVAVRSLQF